MAADAKSTQARTATHWQRFSVPYEYPVVFTEGVFDPDNPALRDKPVIVGGARRCIESIAWYEAQGVDMMLFLVQAGKIRHDDIVAGRTIQIGYRPFEELERVELIVEGTDVTYPSSNLAYRKAVLDEIGGFDEWFVTAEDIDLNIRAVHAGHTIGFRADAIVYHRTRRSAYDFVRQAFWNGAGRKQLTMKHGSLWTRYRPVEMFRQSATFWSMVRLSAALMGYVGYKVFARPKVASR